MENDPLQLRMVTPDDIPMIAEWALAHGKALLPAILPALGVLALSSAGVPLAVLWLHMDNSVGVCWPEMPISKPGLSLRKSRSAFVLILGFLEKEAKQNGYGLMLCHTIKPIARILQSVGFQEESRDLIKMFKIL